jgi:hypothetical protein
MIRSSWVFLELREKPLELKKLAVVEVRRRTRSTLATFHVGLPPLSPHTDSEGMSK